MEEEENESTRTTDYRLGDKMSNLKTTWYFLYTLRVAYNVAKIGTY